MATLSFKVPSSRTKTTTASKRSRSNDSRKSDSYPLDSTEFDWPDLPPLTQVRDAITRNRVSHGISYLLPLDSVSTNFRPDLRAMFIEQDRKYDGNLYESSKLRPSAKERVFCNTVDMQMRDKQHAKLPTRLNEDSEKVRKLYGRSAPRTSSARRRMGLDTRKSRQRSNISLSVKIKEPPEATQMRDEVEKILNSLKECDDDNDDVDHSKDRKLQKEITVKPLHRESTVFKDIDHHAFLSAKMEKLALNTNQYTTYEKLNNRKPELIIPNDLRSTYLSDESNEEIWKWLHRGDCMSDLDFFLSVCG